MRELSGLGGMYKQQTERGMCKWSWREITSKWSGLDSTVAWMVCLSATSYQGHCSHCGC